MSTGHGKLLTGVNIPTCMAGWHNCGWHVKAMPYEKQTTSMALNFELTYDDLDELEYAVQNNRLPPTSGFFFGEGADDYYKPSDLKFIQEARAEMFLGLKVFYNSSW
jgi:hypothetical protein